MLNLYTEKKAKSIIARNRPIIEALSRRYPLPAACLQAILFQELIQIDLLDVFADLAVRSYWVRYSLRRRLWKLGLVRHPEPWLRWGVFGKRDSSTGYAQIFAYVGIKAVNFALGRGLADRASLGIPAGYTLSADNLDDLRRVWLRLYRDTGYNLELAALNLLAAGEEMTGRVDFAHYTESELMLVFTRYNANVRHITDYGRQAYRHYTAFLHQPEGTKL